MHNYFDDEPSPNPYPIPPSYSSLREALQRAIEKWGISDGRAKLLGLLAFGQLAWWESSYNGFKKGEKSFWAKLSPEDLEKIFREDRYGDSPRGFVRTGWERADGWRPVFLTEDIDAMFPSDSKLEERPKTAVSSSVNKGGSPYKYDWEPVWVEMCAYIEREGVPDTYAEMVNFIHKWMLSKTDKSPSLSHLHSKVKKLVDRLRNDEGSPPITG
jgi:hypothetical protein